MIVSQRNWKVGELPKQTGLTVRMLHHYDKIGLFCPSQYTDTGHRLYTEADIARLQQIVSLKQLGFGLEEIKKIINKSNFNPLEVVKVQLESVKERIRVQEQLYDRLEKIYELLNCEQQVTPEQFINVIEVMNMKIDGYFSPGQLAEMARQMGDLIEPEKRKKYVLEWSQLVKQMRAEMEKGTPAETLDVTRLAELTEMLTGSGSPQIV
ncbi:MerR family transcriptional regulator [Bacillus sp. 165]|nr:MerR family transcriptional regulator [Bacillus sp. 165]MBO9130641.1 MerR family transcriptional regulator [Bacillus sp. 165]